MIDRGTDWLRQVNRIATIVRPIVRVERRKGMPVGHASIATQLDWCAQAGISLQSESANRDHRQG